MFTPSKSRRAAFALAVLGVCCAPALADEFQYLPDNIQVIASIDVTAGAKTKSLKEFMKLSGATVGKEAAEEMKAYVAKISHVTAGVGMTQGDKGTVTDEIDVATAIRPISVDDAKELRKGSGSSFRKNHAFKEIKHGSVTIYQETYQTQFGKDDKLSKVIEGEAFFLAEGKYIVSSKRVETLRKTIDRNKAPKLSPILRMGLKDAAGSMMSVIVDVQNLPADSKADVQRALAKIPAFAYIKADADKVQSLVVKMDEVKGNFRLSATVTCSEEASAAAIKKASDKALEFIIVKANEKTYIEKSLELSKDKLDPDLEKTVSDSKKHIKSARAALKAIQLSSAGAKVTASLELEPETAVQAMMGSFVVGVNFIEVAPPKKSKIPDPKK